MTQTDKDTDTLKNLLQVAVDGEKGFRKAMRTCTDASKPVQDFLCDAHASCVRAASELREALAGRGADTDEEGSLGGDLHRGWMETRAAFTSNEAEAYLAEVVRGEEYAVKRYEEALEKTPTTVVRDLISSHLISLRDNLTKAKACYSLLETKNA